jgi:hypothetical protein
MTDQYVTWDAAYVLGALSDGDRHEYEGHLRGCAGCQRAVGDLAGMPGLLRQLTREDVESIERSGQLDDRLPAPPAETFGALVQTVRRKRRRGRLLAWSGGFAAAAAVAIGLFMVLRAAPGAAPPAPQAEPPTRSMTAVTPSALTATYQLVGHDWGTGIAMHCSYGREAGGEADQDEELAMVAVGRDGSRTQVATWVARSGVPAAPAGSVSLPINEIASVQVVSVGSGELLLQSTP